MPLSTVEVFGIACEPIKQEKDICAARNSVTNPRTFLQQTLLPYEFSTSNACVQILRLLIDQIGLCKEIRHTCKTGQRHQCNRGGSESPDTNTMMCINSTECTRGSVAPVHQLVLSFDDGSQLCRPVTVLLLVHEEIDALPHQIFLCPAEHVLVAQQHLQDRREAVGCT